MISVYLNGRLGNQLFQYAFAVALSKRLNTFYVIDDKDSVDSVKKYFKPISIVDNKYLRRIIKKLNNYKLAIVEQTGFEESSTDESFINDNTYYKGFFQSEIYSTNISSLANIFKIKSVYEKIFVKTYSNFFSHNKVIAVHCRIGDYAAWGGEILGGTNMVLPESYYENALKLIPDLDSYKIIVVTDDIVGAQNKFSFLKEKSIVSDQEIIDFQILMHADKLIISNSTFAWWAALLNVKQAQVFAPEFWLGFKVRKEYPIGIMHSRFHRVSF